MHLIYKQLRLYISLHIKKQHVFLLRKDYFSNQIEFDLKSINQEFILFRKPLNEQSA